MLGYAFDLSIVLRLLPPDLPPICASRGAIKGLSRAAARQEGEDQEHGLHGAAHAALLPTVLFA